MPCTFRSLGALLTLCTVCVAQAHKVNSEFLRAALERALERAGPPSKAAEMGAALRHMTLSEESIVDKPGGTGELDAVEHSIRALLEPGLLAQLDEILSQGNDVMRTGMRQLTEALNAQSGRVIDLFKKYDVDRDGKITQAEFQKAAPTGPHAVHYMYPHRAHPSLGALL